MGRDGLTCWVELSESLWRDGGGLSNDNSNEFNGMAGPAAFPQQQMLQDYNGYLRWMLADSSLFQAH